MALQSRENRVLALRSKSKSSSAPAQSKVSSTDARLDMLKSEEDVMRTLKQMEEQHRWTTANTSVKFWQGTLATKLGDHTKASLKNLQRSALLPKQRKPMSEKAKDMRMSKDIMTKSMKGDLITRTQQEMAFTHPTVRTALRIHDDMDLQEQLATTADDAGPMTLGTSTAFIDTILKLNLLQGEVKELRKEREFEERRAAARLATIEHYKQVKMPVDEGMVMERPKEWTAEQKAAMERPMTVAVGKFDRWLGRRVVPKMDCDCISLNAELQRSRSAPSRDMLKTR